MGGYWAQDKQELIMTWPVGHLISRLDTAKVRNFDMVILAYLKSEKAETWQECLLA